jgi:hypothetical protein
LCAGDAEGAPRGDERIRDAKIKIRHFGQEASNATKGDIDEAKTALTEARRLNPKLSVKWLMEGKFTLRPSWIDALRKAGATGGVKAAGACGRVHDDPRRIDDRVHERRLTHALRGPASRSGLAG